MYRLHSYLGALFVLFVCTGSAKAIVVSIDPDAFADGTDISNAFPDITLSAQGASVSTSAVFSDTATIGLLAPTPVLGHDGSFPEFWFQVSGSATLRVDFTLGADLAAVDFLNNNGSDPSIVEAFDSGGNLLAIATTVGTTGAGNIETATIDRLGAFDIAYILATAQTGQDVYIRRVSATVNSDPPPILVDIKPGSFPNSVNLKSKGVLPVAILGTDVFDVNDVDPTTLMFGDPNGGTAVSLLRSALEDVNVDGFLDLSLKFSMAELLAYEALGPDTIEGRLTGFLFDGTPIAGMDSIRIVPPKGSNGNGLHISAVPEPSTLALTALGLLGIGWRRRKRA